MLLRESLDDLFALASAAGESLDLPAEFVEKDFWACELIRSVANPLDDTILIFKGGTSLSKAFGLIDRFSEDVDILIYVTRERDSTFGKGSVDKILKLLCARAGHDLGIAEDGQALISSGTGEHRCVRFAYPARFPSEILTQGLLLEIGVRGGAVPRERKRFRSFVADYALNHAGVREPEYEELRQVEIDVLAPERTLFEKLAMLHDLASRYPDTQEKLERAGHQYYDVCKVLRSQKVLDALRIQPDLARDLSEDINRFSEASGWTFTARPNEGYGASPAFDMGHASFPAARMGYEAALDLIYGERPSMEECFASVKENEGLL